MRRCFDQCGDLSGGSYHIGLVCATNHNIGNHLTNFALYRYLKDLGHTVLLINYCIDGLEGNFELFQELPYPQEDVLNCLRDEKWRLAAASAACEKFVLGSDQLWRGTFIEAMDFFPCLDWAASENDKIAYAVSMGVDHFESGVDVQRKMGYLLKRFHQISVREQDGVKLLWELFGIKAVWVLDPVFLCRKRYYEELAAKGKAETERLRYTAAYILEITEEKEKAVFGVSERLTNGSYLAMTQPGSALALEARLKVLSDPTIEKWLAMVEGCDFMVTDSFHGMCFALIFQKQFCVIFDKDNWRGLSRIQNLLDLLQLSERLIERYDEETVSRICAEKIDYGRVNAVLSRERERSGDWLIRALAGGGRHDEYGIYDFCWEADRDLHIRLQTLEERFHDKIKRLRNELFLMEHKRTGGAGSEAWRKPAQTVGWGAGACFRRNIGRIRSFCDMKYVCDSDCRKWDKELELGTLCISPKTLSQMPDVMVIIMVDNAAAAFQIVRELLDMNITRFEHVENWLTFVEA